MSLLPLRRAPVAWPRLLLVTPPFTQLNTTYAAVPHLMGFLRRHGVPAAQADLSLETNLALFSRAGLGRLFAALHQRPGEAPELARFIACADAYCDTVEPVVRFLQGRDPTFAHRIVHGAVLPRGPRFERSDLDEEWAFGALGVSERARYQATLYLYDLADLVRETVAPHFGLARYGESLAVAASSFDPLAAALAEPPSLVDELMAEAMALHLAATSPDLVGFTIPFPGNLYGALRLAQVVRQRRPEARIVLGGGYVNTELRQLTEPRLFDLVDYVTLDDGEGPLLALLAHLAGVRPEGGLRRTLLRRQGEVVRVDGDDEPEVPQSELGAPSYRGLPTDRYLHVVELGNPMHRLWSDGRWNKLTVAHGCYWKRCTFCDLGLDYIARYEATAARELVERMETLIAETGESGFHFVDEAAPPLTLIGLALELLRRGRTVSFWGNLRFEKTFTVDVCRLLVAAGCIAVTGGLEVASDRLLERIAKGVTVAQVARVAHAFADAGALVHAYLMYGFPTETAQETIDSLERVRQLFAASAIHSAFWHRFVLTRHSPIAKDPAAFGIRILGPAIGPFANNDLRHEDPKGVDPERFAEGLRRAVLNYMHGLGLERDVRSWFDERLPRAKVAPDFVAGAIAEAAAEEPRRPDARLVWIGGPASLVAGRRGGVLIQGRGGQLLVPLPPRPARWVVELLGAATVRGHRGGDWPRKPAVAASCPDGSDGFVELTASPAWAALRSAGLLELP